MEKKKQEKDVLLMRDEKTGEVRVVAGLKGDGTPNLTDATAKNSPAFLHFDRHGDVLDNFFKNFYLQCKEPSRFGFYRIAADQAEQLVEVMKDLLKDPEANKEMLASHKVDTSKYTSQQTTAQEQPKQEDMEQKKEPAPQQEQQPAEGKRRGYEPIDESKIDWADIETRYGVRRDDLEKSGDLKKMLNYGKSDLVNVSPAIGGERFPTEARLSFKRQEDGSVSLTPHFIRKEPDFKQEYKGHTFSEEDIKNLKATGNMGRKVELLDKATGELVPSYVSLDRQTNELTDIAATKVRIRDKIGETTLTKTEQDLLRTGAPLHGKEIQLADGRKFRTTLQVNVEQRGVEFVPRGRQMRQENKDNNTRRQYRGNRREETPEENKRNWQMPDGSIKPIAKWKNIDFTPQQKDDYLAGRTVKLENVLDRKGKPATMYLKFDREKGRPFAYRRNPDTAQKVAPSNESRTQVAVNSEGKTNEATKKVKEPLTKGQTAPKENQQRKQQPRRKGVTM